MYPFIVCPTCGRDIGSVYDAFRLTATKKYQAVCGGIAPDMVALTDVEAVSLKDELDDLGLDTICCRGHLITQVEFKSVY